MVQKININHVAEELYKAEKTRIPVEPLTDRFSAITMEEAYNVQLVNVNRRINQGERIIGKKIGLTSEAMQRFLGVHEPDYGHIFNTMFLLKNELSMSQVIQPKAEGEIAFVMKEDIMGPGVTPLDVMRATDYVIPAIEIIDSRIKEWKIKIQDTVADNASSAFILVGARALSLNEIDLLSTGMVFSKNGSIVATGASAAVMGNPVNAVTWLVNKLAEYNVSVKKGEIVLSGSITAAVDVKKGDVIDVTFDRLGPVKVKVVP
ncbi:MAG: 2-keto-4-pentenoate hydratase [Spirochaetota bacterium]